MFSGWKQNPQTPNYRGMLMRKPPANASAQSSPNIADPLREDFIVIIDMRLDK
jgi:hypothetical protein